MAETPRLWTRIKRAIATFAVVPGILVCLGLGFYYFILDWEGRPFCHKQIHLGMLMWMSDSGTNDASMASTFPNIKGGSYESLLTMSNEFVRIEKWIKDYNYIPGLRQNDPGDLVLMYFNRPTRWTWHGPPPSIFTDKAWIIVPVDFNMGWEKRKGLGELSERVSLDEFKSRLKRTLDFVRTNERPNWQAVVAEHTKVLDALENAKR